MTTKHDIDFSFTGRYVKLGDINEHTREVWFVMHGYGQLAEHFIKKFAALESRDISVIAPEGLSHFYLEELDSRMKSGNNRVGATWMTRENRLTDINNYIHYLDAVYRREIHELSIPVTILGFSQGAATATRWALQGTPKFTRLILWAGLFPPDMDFQKGHDVFSSKKVVAVMGNQDPFVTPARIDEMNRLSDQLGIQPQVIRFEGKHEIDEAVLLSLN